MFSIIKSSIKRWKRKEHWNQRLIIVEKKKDVSHNEWEYVCKKCGCESSYPTTNGCRYKFEGEIFDRSQNCDPQINQISLF